ncbi:TraA fimbrial protein precursor [Aeromonas salmonicida subsp. salmonicida]|nr:TraA fimbrial protein precursor [Aeromonas salmonicida subsp. salmonicida]QEO86278.1 TraA fimbrial protein precursor [Aeromonas salmonicida subsp. salmonicida]QHU98452.1 TraA fimbrial protein precursor [Aeromonas salmonicida subsp. salmonicida]
MALMAVAVLVTLLTFGQAHAVDMLAGQSGTVNDTFGANSTVAKWIILAEVIIGVASYIKTKNLLLLFGVIIVVVFTTVGFQLAA